MFNNPHLNIEVENLQQPDVEKKDKNQENKRRGDLTKMTEICDDKNGY